MTHERSNKKKWEKYSRTFFALFINQVEIEFFSQCREQNIRIKHRSSSANLKLRQNSFEFSEYGTA